MFRTILHGKVVKKIKAMENDPSEMFMGTTFERNLNFKNILTLPIGSSIDVIYSKIIDFIKWYNLQL